MKYKIEDPETLLQKKNNEANIPIYTLQNIHRMIVTSIMKEINNSLIKYNKVELIINNSLMDIIMSESTFSHLPVYSTTDPNYAIGKLFGIDIKVDISNYLKHNEYCFNKDANYISYLERIKLNKKLKKISKI